MVAYNKFEVFTGDLGSGFHDLRAAGHIARIYLANTAPSASLDSIKTDLAEITAGNGYTAGGEDTTNTYTEAGGTATMGATDVVWTASGGNIAQFQYVVLYNDTQTAPVDPLIAWWDNGSAVDLASGESFTVDFTNIFTLV